MADPRGFLKIARAKAKERPPAERVTHYREFVVEPAKEEISAQASRCMDCGIPFCHDGCPLGNLIPEWNDHVYRGQSPEAERALYATNNFPEVTGRVCPAPCEASCVLALEGAPVAIKDVERTIARASFESGTGLVPVLAAARTGKTIAVVGSGPAGLACAQELARRGHDVTVFERDDRLGGLLRYGIPDFKLEKALLDLRLAQLTAEGVVFRTGVDVGKDVSAEGLRADFDAVVLAMGARVPRDLDVPGRNLPGVAFAMDYLTQQNRRVAGDEVSGPDALMATGKHVVVIGGGDTGSDCVGTANRHGAASVTQLELMPKPPLVRMPDNPWPTWPLVLRTSSSQEEGCERSFAVMTTGFAEGPAGGGRVGVLRATKVELDRGHVRPLPGGELTLPCDLALLAMGFTGPETRGLVEAFGLGRDARGNVVSDALGRTSLAGIYAAGDVTRGQSLVVWAIEGGRRVAASVDRDLAERSELPEPGGEAGPGRKRTRLLASV